MFKTLSAKLSVVLLGLLCVIGGLYIGLTLFSTQLYQQEVNQQLNRTLAQHLVSEKILIEEGRVNQPALEELFHMLMAINPNIEIYLLDPHGRVIACSAPPDKLKRKIVALEPIKNFLSGSKQMPILGDDPRDLKQQKIFSVAPIPAKAAARQILPPDNTDVTGHLFNEAQGSPAGYLYVVLGGKAYDSVAEMLQGSYILRLSAWAVAASMLVTLCAGLLMFRFLTRRLTHLSLAMEDFQRNDFIEPTQVNALKSLDVTGGDEIGRLGLSFNQMAERILDQMQRLKQTDTLRRELVANVSHDLRTPLASLQGYIETLLIKEGKLSEQEQRNYLEIALHHSERLAKLIAELFELAKLDAQITPLTLEAIAMGELVQDVVQELQLGAQQKGVVLTTDLQDDLPFVNIDIGLMERVLENLIDNALRYTPSGGAVTISLTRQEEAIRIQVSDTGCGISPDDLPYVFDRFYRVEKTRHQQIGGSGLGLAITKRILELHGTGIQASSVVNRGTTFSFYLDAYEAAQASYSSSRNFSHKAFDEVLQAHVKNGVVDYSAIAADARFAAYLEQLNQVDPHALPTRSKRLAFWINAYNAWAIKGILDGYSPQNRIGRYRYFISKQYRAGGKTLNLHDLQRKILIPEFREPRVHFAIVCASVSCPKLSSRAYNAEILEAQLEQSVIDFVNDPARNVFDREQRLARLSKIFKWFEKDFVMSAGSLIDYLRPYIADPELAKALAKESYEIEFIDYNWNSNGYSRLSLS